MGIYTNFLLLANFPQKEWPNQYKEQTIFIQNESYNLTILESIRAFAMKRPKNLNFVLTFDTADDLAFLPSGAGNNPLWVCMYLLPEPPSEDRQKRHKGKIDIKKEMWKFLVSNHINVTITHIYTNRIMIISYKIRDCSAICNWKCSICIIIIIIVLIGSVSSVINASAFQS